MEELVVWQSGSWIPNLFNTTNPRDEFTGIMPVLLLSRIIFR
jgi:hypothetical protein